LGRDEKRCAFQWKDLGGILAGLAAGTHLRIPVLPLPLGADGIDERADGLVGGVGHIHVGKRAGENVGIVTTGANDHATRIVTRPGVLLECLCIDAGIVEGFVQHLDKEFASFFGQANFLVVVVTVVKAVLAEEFEVCGHVTSGFVRVIAKFLSKHNRIMFLEEFGRPKGTAFAQITVQCASNIVQ